MVTWRRRTFKCIERWATMVDTVRPELGPLTLTIKSGNPFLLKDVMNVPGLKKNLVSVAMLED